MAKITIRSEVFKISSPYGWVRRIGNHREGSYTLNEGVVRIYAQDQMCSFTFVIGGRVYSEARYGKGVSKYTDLGLIRLAGKFARKSLEHCGID